MKLSFLMVCMNEETVACTYVFYLRFEVSRQKPALYLMVYLVAKKSEMLVVVTDLCPRLLLSS